MAMFAQEVSGTDTNKTDDGQINIKATGDGSVSNLTMNQRVAGSLNARLGELLGIADTDRMNDDFDGLQRECDALKAELRMAVLRQEELADTIKGLKAERTEWPSAFTALQTKFLALEKKATAREEELLETITGLRSQLPEGVGGGTITYKRCKAGHQRLVSDDWLLSECPFCQINVLKTKLADVVPATESELESTALLNKLSDVLGDTTELQSAHGTMSDKLYKLTYDVRELVNEVNDGKGNEDGDKTHGSR